MKTRVSAPASSVVSAGEVAEQGPPITSEPALKIADTQRKAASSALLAVSRKDLKAESRHGQNDAAKRLFVPAFDTNSARPREGRQSAMLQQKLSTVSTREDFASLLNAIAELPQSVRPEAFAAAVDALARLEPTDCARAFDDLLASAQAGSSERQRALLYNQLAEGITVLRGEALANGFAGLVSRVAALAVACRGAPLTSLVRQLPYLPEALRATAFGEMLAGTCKLPSEDRRKALTTLAERLSAVPEAHAARALDDMIKAIRPLPASSRGQVLEALASQLARGADAAVKFSFEKLGAAIDTLPREEQAAPLSALCPHLARLDAGDRPAALGLLLASISTLPDSVRDDPVMQLTQLIACMPAAEQGASFHAVLAEVGKLEPRSAIAPLELIVFEIHELPECVRAHAFTAVCATAQGLPPARRIGPLSSLLGEIENLPHNEMPRALNEALQLIVRSPIQGNERLLLKSRVELLVEAAGIIGELPAAERRNAFMAMLYAQRSLPHEVRVDALAALTHAVGALPEPDCLGAIKAVADELPALLPDDRGRTAVLLLAAAQRLPEPEWHAVRADVLALAQ